ncbi:uncharacterized protein LOC107040697 [Diachasma alloeum]|uniref:uncharacterized protein LOC107040697 n=1 Tax=Diachasma alloeum TaxID=454923 RepID=UPI000738248D|nr:uncharacterized protein LOC107040697 [Diachasma alloeum]
MNSFSVRGWCLLILCLFAAFVTPARGIECYRCNNTSGKHQFQCNEFLTDDIDMVPESCDDVFGAQYCVKHVGRYEGGIGTKRYCSSVHMGNYCNYAEQVGDSLEYRTCVYTCSSDGCNPGTRVTTSAGTISLITIFTLLYTFSR